MRSFIPYACLPAIEAGIRGSLQDTPSIRCNWIVRRGGREMCAASGNRTPHETKFGQDTEIGYPNGRLVTAVESTTEEAILPRLAAGENAAMGECIDRYGNLVWGIVRKSIKDPTEAEDLVQEVFTEIWKKAAFFDARMASESTFIGLVARRRAIDFLRRQGRQPGFEPLDAAESVPAPAAAVPSIHCDPEVLKSLIASLPADTRELFRHFFEDGFTHPEIAEKTGLPLGTVKTRLRRGLIALRDQLGRVGISNIQPAS